MSDEHSAPDFGCRCGRGHCATCGDIWPCRAAYNAEVKARVRELGPTPLQAIFGESFLRSSER